MKKSFFVLVLLLMIFMVSGCTSTKPTITEEPKSENKTVKKEEIKEEKKTDSTLEDYINNNKMKNVTIKTNFGEIKIELDLENAPISSANFKRYIEEGFYTNTIFHRVMDGFMIQGGGFDVDKNQKSTHEPIKNEADNGLKNDRGTIAMARTGIIDSATSQFFINHIDNDFLNFKAPNVREYGYAVFGHVTEGMDVVDAIAKVKVANNGGHQNWPVEAVIIESITIDE